MNHLNINLHPKAGESLSPLVLELLTEFPDLPTKVDQWD